MSVHNDDKEKRENNFKKITRLWKGLERGKKGGNKKLYFNFKNEK